MSYQVVDERGTNARGRMRTTQGASFVSEATLGTSLSCHHHASLRRPRSTSLYAPEDSDP
jgi:hypothetical protein